MNGDKVKEIKFSERDILVRCMGKGRHFYIVTHEQIEESETTGPICPYCKDDLYVIVGSVSYSKQYKEYLNSITST